MKYLTFDADGTITGAFIQDLREEHADCYIEVSDEQYEERFALMVKGGKLVAAPPPSIPDPEPVVIRSKEQILADLDALRAEVETLSTFDQLQALSNG